jgi:hypothetical protein
VSKIDGGVPLEEWHQPGWDQSVWDHPARVRPEWGHQTARRSSSSEDLASRSAPPYLIPRSSHTHVAFTSGAAAMSAFSTLLCTLATVQAAYLAPIRSARVAAAHVTRQGPVVCADKPTDANGEPIKAALSSYMLFCGERRAALTQDLKAKLGDSFKNTLVMSELGNEWKALGEAEKNRFAAAAAADKTRFDAAVASNPANAKLRGSKRTKKASTGPKKLSAYIHVRAAARSDSLAPLDNLTSLPFSPFLHGS